MTSPMQVTNWVNAQQQVMPVKFKLKKDESASGLEAADVQRVVNYAASAFPTAKFPEGSFIAVARDPGQPKEMDSYINTQKGVYHFNAEHKKDPNALSALFTQMGRFLRDNNLPAFAGKGVATPKPQPKALAYIA